MGLTALVTSVGNANSTRFRLVQFQALPVPVTHPRIALSTMLLTNSMQVLTESSSYIEALEAMESEPLTAPAYFIMAGSQPGAGAVVTRDRNFLTNLWVLDVSASVPNSWYLLETNYVSLHIAALHN